MTSRKFGWMLLAALGLAGFAGDASAQTTAAPKKIDFVLNYVLYGRHAPFFLGIDKGYYKDAGFDVSVLPSTGSGFAISAVDGGKGDFGLVESATLIQAIVKGAKVKAFEAFLESTPNGLASLKPYASIKDVLGSKVAAAVTDSARSVLPIVVELNGLDPAKLEWQAASNQTYISLLMGGQIDSFSAAIDADIPPLLKLLKPQGKQPYFASFAGWGYDGLGFLLIASNDRLAKSPDEVKAFAAANVKSVEYSIAHPEEAVAAMIKHNPTLDPDITAEQWHQTTIAIQTPYKAQHGFGVVTKDRVQRTIDLAKKAFKFEANVPPEQIYAEGFVTK